MELVLPSNFIEIDQEEMMYLDGGDWTTFRNNIIGLAAASQVFRWAARDTGLWKLLFKGVTYSYSWTLSTFAPILGSVTAVNFAIGLVAGVAVAAIGWTLWNYKFC